MPDTFFREHHIVPRGKAWALVRAIPGTENVKTLRTHLTRAEALRMREFVRRVVNVFILRNVLSNRRSAARARVRRKFVFEAYEVEKAGRGRWRVVERTTGTTVTWARTQSAATNLCALADESIDRFRFDNGYLIGGEGDDRTEREIDRMNWLEARRDDPERALLVIFAQEREKFLRTFDGAARDRVKKATLGFHHTYCPRGLKQCAMRDVAWVSLDSSRVHFVRRAAEELPYENLVALVRHELGHLIDEEPDRDGSERRADTYAEKAGGEPIRYDDSELQTIGPGALVRPDHLHQ